MDSSQRQRGELASVLGSSDFRRLWLLGGIVNAMRWTEMLAAGLFTFRVTGSALDVATVLAARSLPMLLLGAFAGVVCDAVDRKRILFLGMLLSAASAAVLAGLAAAGVARPWHVAVAALVSGSVWATEMSARRRMVGECAGPDRVSRAVALDSLTNALARIAGPLLGSVLFAGLGLAGAYAVSAVMYLVGAVVVLGVRHAQVPHRLRLRRVPSELAEGFLYAARQVTVLGVLGVTAAMNLFAFSYTATVAPLARLGFGVSDAMTGLLAAGEPVGAFLGGLLLAGRPTPRYPLALLIAGSALFTASLAVMPLMPSYGAACLVLVLGGLGLALFGNMQSGLILTAVPAPLRSRQMGLITVCIGVAPLGQLLMGLLAGQLGALRAVVASALLGLVALAAVAVLCRRGLGAVPVAPVAEDAPSLQDYAANPPPGTPHGTPQGTRGSQE